MKLNVSEVMPNEDLPNINGCSFDHFVLHLKECEFRFNRRGEDLRGLVSRVSFVSCSGVG
jgi:transposase-like protein